MPRSRKKRRTFQLPNLALGSWRLLLAAFVAMSHLWNPMIPGYAAYAVWGFFVLSGYLMTFVLTEKYGFTSSGVLHYARNRFLRIMPTYWLALIIGIFTIIYLNGRNIRVDSLNAAFTLPKSPEDWIFPITLFIGFPSYYLPVPVAKALGVEVGIYFLMPLLSSRKIITWIALCVGIIANVYLYSNDSDFYDRYMGIIPRAIARTGTANMTLMPGLQFHLSPTKF